jgi:Galactose oxidase, central domain
VIVTAGRPRRAVGRLAVGLLLGACATAPAESAPTASPSAPASASATAAPSVVDGADDGPPPCLDAKLVYADALGRMLLAACVDQFDLASVEHLWAWDGEIWQLVDGEGLPANVVTGVGWDSERDVLVRYGGIPLPSQECSPDTWEWDTVEWSRLDVEPPGPCDHHELAWDASAGRMLLVGGGRAQNLMPGTWAWDGAAWSQLTDAGPAPRAHHGLVSDPAGDRAVLHGGFDGNAVFDDLWSWDGSAWEELATTGDAPGPRSHHGLAASSAGILLFGGATRTSTFGSLVDETWLLADGEWSRLDVPGPSARGLPAMGYDPDRDVIVLHGGFGPDGGPMADTWEWDGTWRCIAGC